MPPSVAPAPVTIGSAQVLEVAHPPAPTPVHVPQLVMPPMPPQAALPPAPVAAAAAIPHGMHGAPAANPAVAQSVATLEATLQRLEESFAFAVECMQTDMAHAREQLRQLKAQLG